MYSGELEVQAKRKAIAVLQDEINRILNAARELATLPELMMKKDKTGIKNALEQISTIEEEVYITKNGCEFISPPQKELILVKP